jgi:uncharacterized protein (TIGR03435 family)
MRRALAVGILLAAPTLCLAQPSDSKYVFDAFSIKLAPPDDGRNMVHLEGGLGTPDPGQATYKNVTLRWLVGLGYPSEYKIVGPDSMDSVHYDVIVKIPSGTTKDQFKLMVQNLLEERAGLKVHHETREFQTYDLVIAKGGPKLTESVEDSATGPQAEIGKLDDDGFPKLVRPGIRTWNGSGPGGTPVTRLAAKAQTMSNLAGMLRTAVQTQVVDKTGLQGKYDFKLEYSFGSAMTTSPYDGSASPPAPSVFYAIKGLGLALQERKTPLEVLVVDHADKVLKPN